MGAPKGHKPYPGCEKGGPLGGRPRELTREVIDKHVESLLAYANDPNNLTLRGWCARQNKGEEYMWDIEASEAVLVSQVGGEKRFSQAIKATLAIIGERRETMAMRGDFKGDTGIVRLTMPTYDKYHRKITKEMKAVEAPKPTQIIVERSVIKDDNNKD